MFMTYKDLTVWQKSMDLVVEVYRLTEKLPKDEIYGLTNQIKRAVVSIPSNIAEGNARFSTKEYLRFLSIARGSQAEVATQLLLCVRLGYLSEGDIADKLSLLNEIERMLNSMISKLRDRA